MKVSFIGGGVMAQAIISGVKDAGLDTSIVVGEPFEARRKSLESEFDIETTRNNTKAIHNADIVILSVKPQHLDTVAN